MLAESLPAPMPVQATNAPVEAEQASLSEPAAAPSTSQGETASSPVASAVAPPALLEADGTIAAHVFGLFSEGKPPVQVVIETQLAPALVERLYEAWLHLNAKDVTSPAACSRIDELAAKVKTLQDEVDLLKASDHVARLVVDNHGEDLRGLANQIAGIVERLGALEEQVADRTVRAMAEDTNATVDCLIPRIEGLEQALRAWTAQMQAAGQVRRLA
jgi:hypothetical protein